MTELALAALIALDDKFEDDLADPGSIRARCDKYEVSSTQALAASILAREHHRRLYGIHGELGEPLTTGIEETDEGFRKDYVGGRIEVRHHVPGPTEPHAETFLHAIVEYVGLRCNEPNETYDEPYIVFNVVNLNPHRDAQDEIAAVKRIGPLEDVVDGEVIGDTQTVWEGRVPGSGLKITAGVYEYDMGDPDDVEAEIKTKVKEYAQQAAGAIASAYGAGGAEAEQIAGSEVVDFFATVFTLGIMGIFDPGDDYIGYRSQDISPQKIREYMTYDGFAASLQTTTEGLQYNYKLDVASEDEGNYSVYVRVRGYEVTQTKPPELPGR